MNNDFDRPLNNKIKLSAEGDNSAATSKTLLEEILDGPQRYSASGLTSSTSIVEETKFEDIIKGIMDGLTKDHPQIIIDSGILGGMPHINGFRLSVGDVLEKIYIYESIDKIREIYPDITKDQIKEAIAFAQDYLEETCASCKPY